MILWAISFGLWQKILVLTVIVGFLATWFDIFLVNRKIADFEFRIQALRDTIALMRKDIGFWGNLKRDEYPKFNPSERGGYYGEYKRKEKRSMDPR
jgi:hypothetical protein